MKPRCCLPRSTNSSMPNGTRLRLNAYKLQMKTARLSFILILAFATLAGAAEITGTVTNRTNNTPAARADVILLKLAQGMEEASRTKTDAQGRYRLTLDDPNAPHLIRVVFQDATYHKAAQPGMTNADIDVYDSAPK